MSHEMGSLPLARAGFLNADPQPGDEVEELKVEKPKEKVPPPEEMQILNPCDCGVTEAH